MTAKQIAKKLHDAGMNLDNITILCRDEVELHVDGDDEATEDLLEAVQAILGWGGYRTGYGSYVLRNGYRVSSLEGFADPIHY